MKLWKQAPLWRRVMRLLGRQLLRLAENNDDARFSRNGEAWLLQQLLAARGQGPDAGVFLAIDGGANAGDYTRAIIAAAGRSLRKVEVHSFEPSPHCLERLHQEFGCEPAVRLVGAALSDRSGEAALHDGRAGSSQASLVPRSVQSGNPAATITVPLLRLGDYLETQAIARVDLLKLDVEGSELAALRGLGEKLRPEIVDLIQFEYGGAALCR